ncbi:MAG: hypothetical protein KBD01_11705 [Acidobacteria bacterium]|nr:hypothetical protein [Acidobacteriota bacterium]
MSIGLIYIFLLVVGVTYAIISGALGWVADLGDGDIHVDAGGHVETDSPHPVSGTTIATFITGFGAGGTIGHYVLAWRRVPSLGLATASGICLAALAYGVLTIIFRQTQAGSEFAADEVVGREAEIITPIVGGGTGEIAFVIKGQREHASARTLDGSDIPRGRLVVIEKVVGPTVYVRART